MGDTGMKIIRYKLGDSVGVSCPVVALGFFDGVHIAHRALINKAVTLASEMGVPSAVFTFSSEDKDIKGGVKRLYTTEEKLDVISTLGVDVAIVADYSSLKDLSPEEFVRGTLSTEIGCTCAVAGFNFKFGKGATATSECLRALMEKNNGCAVIMDEYTHEGKTVSSTLIRELLAEGRVDAANTLLGAPYFLSGKVTHGEGMGKGLGFPTINTDISNVEMRRGVYRTAIKLGSLVLPGITNVGTCPTLGIRTLHAETNIIGYDGDLYGKNVKIFFLEFIRDEIVFDSKEKLIMQINVDKIKVIERNRDIKWQEFGLSLP
jgi:riboflavin kinase/FMN adenylyltransferase